MIFFSPFLYLSVIWLPLTPCTICATVALVMVLLCQVPRPMTLASAAHRLGEDMDLHRLLAAVGLRPASYADEGVILYSAECRLGDAAYGGVIGQFDRVIGPFSRFDRQNWPVDAFDCATQPNRHILNHWNTRSACGGHKHRKINRAY